MLWSILYHSSESGRATLLDFLCNLEVVRQGLNELLA
ncbi:MAG: hypothetical protein D4R65_06530 [Verrucomicrobiaceae bacterium]|nr:MAG: hypothetical protein D4R65_06530 [Verrucomicrobiaceae bacterium]